MKTWKSYGMILSLKVANSIRLKLIHFIQVGIFESPELLLISLLTLGLALYPNALYYLNDDVCMTKKKRCHNYN